MVGRSMVIFTGICGWSYMTAPVDNTATSDTLSPFLTPPNSGGGGKSPRYSRRGKLDDLAPNGRPQRRFGNAIEERTGLGFFE